MAVPQIHQWTLKELLSSGTTESLPHACTHSFLCLTDTCRSQHCLDKGAQKGPKPLEKSANEKQMGADGTKLIKGTPILCHHRMTDESSLETTGSPFKDGWTPPSMHWLFPEPQQIQKFWQPLAHTIDHDLTFSSTASNQGRLSKFHLQWSSHNKWKPAE